ncbi:ABC transporter permease/M1 family aminopeptidase [Chitinophaga pinensis]|uniref:Peptidase M1 membrane alanine aminopeptidase n=1 Tax=Chitinophaga pinensis (strain ATCC 43595 / DSM 2588 / LMG 13176 / NBRC 15968 / NCIMB 11800 / UQM 2034) TaxID=485918 RepID=A0A979G803_CHIPD|nr:M1 family aminopeptidase [Chitinophaga pinensis]ACU62664.1 Peptidase M1 membrane alanine aminopeptidase [Chitinophaga pinensis DSM 2588]
MLSALLRFELYYHFRQITFKVTALLFLLLGMLCVHGHFGGNAIHANAPYVVTYLTGFLSLFTIFVSSLFCANVILRDQTYKMEQLLFTTAIQKPAYFIVRFTGLLLTVFLTISLCTLGIGLGACFADSDRLGPFHPIFFLQPLLIFGLPNVLFVSTVIFCTAVLSRSAKAIYTAGVLLYVLYSIAAILGNSPLFASSSLKTGTPDILPLLTDPFGLAIFLGDTRQWSDLQRNEQLYPLRGLLLQNRLIWGSFSLLLLFVTYSAYAFRLRFAKVRKVADKQPTGITAIPYSARNTMVGGAAYYWQCFLAQWKLETAQVFKHIPFLVMLALWIFVYAIELKDTLINGAYGVQFYPFTSIIIETLRSVKPAMLLIIFYTAEIVSRERSVNIQGLLYSTPVRNSIMWAAKCASLVILIATLIAANIGIGIGLQLSKGYYHFELSRYSTLFYYSGLPLLLFAVLALFIQTLAGNKYLGMVLNMFVAVLIIFGRRIGLEHYLFRYATTPDMDYSDMNGFGNYAPAFNWYMLYWLSFALLLAMLSINRWQRSAHIRIGFRLRRIWLLPISLFLVCGSYIYYKTNIESSYRNATATLDWRLNYERQYRAIANLPQPVITSVRTTVDIYPGSNSYHVKGTYTLHNETESDIATVWLGVDPQVNTCRFFLPDATQKSFDPVFKQSRYELKRPLLPGQAIQLQFDMTVIRSGFTPLDKENTVVSNGSYIELEKYVPFLGYNDRFEVSDSITRRKHGMPSYVALLSTDSNYHRINYEATISVPAGQQVVTIGQLQNNWQEKGRSYFHYKTVTPVNFMFALSAGEYAVKREQYKGINYAVYYHPAHTANINAMLQAMKDAIDYGTTHFSAYPHQTLTLAEIPQYKGAATAYPGVIFSAENLNFKSNFSDSNTINYAYGTTVHEVAHQWWANLLTPADQPGRAFLTETLAQYTEAMVLEQHGGRPLMRKYLRNDNHLYFAMRGPNEVEQPLAAAIDQSAVCYQKGTLAMYALKETLGEECVNHALQQLLRQHAWPGQKAIAQDLLTILRTNASPQEIKTINDWLTKTYIYAQEINVLSCQQQSNGQYKLTVAVKVIKQDLQTDKEIVPDDDIDIAVFDKKQQDWHRNTNPVYLKKHHFSKTNSVLTILTDQAPKTVVIDPYCYLPDPVQENNTKEL